MIERVRQGAMPTPELFMLVDERPYVEFLYARCKQYDENPAVSETLRLAHRARMLAMDPAWELGKFSSIVTNAAKFLPLPPQLAPKTAVFKSKMPKALPHYDQVYGYGFDPNQGLANNIIDIVSTEWKCAIESIEPGLHEVCPIVLRFAGGATKDYFMFRCRQLLEIVDHSASDVLVARRLDGAVVSCLDPHPRFVSVKRGAVLGRHWMEHLESSNPFGKPFVSLELAIKLHRLLPQRTRFDPVPLTDSFS